MRLREALLHGGTQLGGWRTPQIHEAMRAAFGLSAGAYTLTQLRYDLRKTKGHGLPERDGRRYGYGPSHPPNRPQDRNGLSQRSAVGSAPPNRITAF
jgi:hypothetical protein